MRSGIQPDRGRGDEGVEPVAGRRTGGVNKTRNTRSFKLVCIIIDH